MNILHAAKTQSITALSTYRLSLLMKNIWVNNLHHNMNRVQGLTTGPTNNESKITHYRDQLFRSNNFIISFIIRFQTERLIIEVAPSCFPGKDELFPDLTYPGSPTKEQNKNAKNLPGSDLELTIFNEEETQLGKALEGKPCLSSVPYTLCSQGKRKASMIMMSLEVFYVNGLWTQLSSVPMTYV